MVHVPPPFVVVTTTATSLMVSSPVAQQSEAFAHDKPSTPFTPLGRLWVPHVWPPSVVATMTFPPNAQQANVEAHEMKGTLTPFGRL
jgi:hypothetical protein